MNKLILLLLLTLGFTAIESKERNRKKLIIVSIDGLPGYYLSEGSVNWTLTPNLKKLKEKSFFSNSVHSVYPTMTYPAHTSMITGVDPIEHGIYFNNPIDPMKKTSGDWMWFREDIKVNTIYDYAKKAKLITASLYWPVTVGANIDYNIPQFWKNKTEYDEKYLSAFSTPGLYKELKQKIGKTIGESTGDEEKVDAALALWNKVKPDLLLIYTTDLDSVHHVKGVNSVEAMVKLQKADSLIGKIINTTNLLNDKNLAMLVVSDHGFKEVNAICSPNKLLIDKGLISVEKGKWNYVFKSLGGISILLKNTDNDTMLSSTVANVNFLKEEVMRSCSGVIADTNGEIATNVNNKMFPNSLLTLYSKENTVFSESLSATEIFKKVSTYYNHGFLPEDDAMLTVGFVYPKSLTKELTDVKDYFKIGCKWLKMSCKK